MIYKEIWEQKQDRIEFSPQALVFYVIVGDGATRGGVISVRKANAVRKVLIGTA